MTICYTRVYIVNMYSKLWQVTSDTIIKSLYTRQSSALSWFGQRTVRLRAMGHWRRAEITRGISYNPQTLTGISFDFSPSLNFQLGGWEGTPGKREPFAKELNTSGFSILEFKEWTQQKLKSMLPSKVNWQKQCSKPWNVIVFWLHLLNCHTVLQNYIGKEILGNVVWVKVGWQSKMPCSGLLWTIS